MVSGCSLLTTRIQNLTLLCTCHMGPLSSLNNLEQVNCKQGQQAVRALFILTITSHPPISSAKVMLLWMLLSLLTLLGLILNPVHHSTFKITLVTPLIMLPRSTVNCQLCLHQISKRILHRNLALFHHSGKVRSQGIHTDPRHLASFVAFIHPLTRQWCLIRRLCLSDNSDSIKSKRECEQRLMMGWRE